MRNPMVDDVQSKIDEAERAVNAIKDGYVCDLASNIEQALKYISKAEYELSYVDDEFADAQELLEEIENRYGSTDPDDWNIPDEDEVNELRELRGLAKQHKVLEAAHDVQRRIISGLLTHVRELNGATSEDTITCIMDQAGRDEEKTYG